MSNGLVFSWAEDVNGKLVHVDNVPNGLECNCICPNCKEKLLARHGDIREHGFAHHSETRRANLEICYMVILYKLAEHLLQIKKRIRVPAYYGIFKEKDIEFTNVMVDSRYEREDKQPDVVATTKDGEQYLVEFSFKHKVQHKKEIDYHNLSCIEIDLSGQTLESLNEFLFNSSDNRRWVNNDNYFNCLETVYRNANKKVKLKLEKECVRCKIKDSCCAIRIAQKPIIINNNGQSYRICKVEEYNHLMEEYEIKSHERNCFNCKINLAWANKDGMANCGAYERLGISRNIDPNFAEECRYYNPK